MKTHYKKIYEKNCIKKIAKKFIKINYKKFKIYTKKCLKIYYKKMSEKLF